MSVPRRSADEVDPAEPIPAPADPGSGPLPRGISSYAYVPMRPIQVAPENAWEGREPSSSARAPATARSAGLAILWVTVALIAVVLALSLWSIPFGTESFHPEEAGIDTMLFGMLAAAISVAGLVAAVTLRAVKLIGWMLPVVMLCLLVASGACVYAGKVHHENTCNTDRSTRYRCGID